jgi:imidazolonepropionase-like amidohydrolase
MLRILAAAAATILLAATAFADQQPSFRFDNGLWFNGERFVAATVFVDYGQLRFAKDKKGARAPAEQVVDLAGKHVAPPFCEAHNHNLGLDDLARNKLALYNYLRDGIFYVKVLSNLPRQSAAVWGTYNRPDSVDAVFPNGGITGPGGHPIRLRERLLDQGVYEGFTKETLKDHAYYVVESDADIEAKWPLILQYRPDFLKMMLVESEYYAERRDDPAFFGLKGLSPQIFAKLVEKAHKNNLRVSVHVESVSDFRAAVAAGVEEIAHLPGYRAPQILTKADATEVARRGMVVVTTAGLIKRWKEKEPERYAAVREAQIANLRLLKEARVKLAVGSDEYDDTSVAEVDHLRGLGVFNDADILRMWTANCAGMFSARRIGQLADGYEASFIAFDSDPLKDFGVTRSIALRVKDGRVLELGPPPPEPPDEEN